MKDMQKEWDLRWQKKASTSLTPDPWLLRAMPFLSPGSVLDIACGRGRNSLYLAEHGFAVTGVDISGQGLNLFRQEAATRNLSIELVQSDLEKSPTLPEGPFDVVSVFFYLQRSLLPAIKDTIRPGGFAVLRTFSKAGDFPGGPDNPDIVLQPGELLEVFNDWEILLHEEGLEKSGKTDGGLAGIVARKPKKTQGHKGPPAHLSP